MTISAMNCGAEGCLSLDARHSQVQQVVTKYNFII